MNKAAYTKLKAKFLLDASGFARVLPRMLGLEKPSHLPSRTSYFTHVEDNIDCGNFDRDKILITVNPNDSDIWYWLIPFSDGSSSIGVVGKPEQFSQNDSAEVILKHFIHAAPNLHKLLRKSKMAQ